MAAPNAIPRLPLEPLERRDLLEESGDTKVDRSPAAATPAAPRWARRWIALIVFLAIAGACAGYLVYASHFEDTDDAEIDGNISNVSPKISAAVTAVYVEENQFVREGDLLAELDPVDVTISVDQARAQVAQAEGQLAVALAGVAAARKDVYQTRAQLMRTAAANRTAQLEKQRTKTLLSSGAVSQAEFDNTTDLATASSATVEAARQALLANGEHVNAQQAQVLVAQAMIEAAKAQLSQAEENLSHAKLVAPVTGIVAKKLIAVGDRLAPGQLVFAISQVKSLWVTANFRETQLERIHAGEQAVVHVDALHVDLRGSVTSVGGATGSKLSLLPPENASGNYVKVVQRVPVRIDLDPTQNGLDRLRIGMSVEPTVRVR